MRGRNSAGGVSFQAGRHVWGEEEGRMGRKGEVEEDMETEGDRGGGGR